MHIGKKLRQVTKPHVLHVHCFHVHRTGNTLRLPPLSESAWPTGLQPGRLLPKARQSLAAIIFLSEAALAIRSTRLQPQATWGTQAPSSRSSHAVLPVLRARPNIATTKSQRSDPVFFDN